MFPLGHCGALRMYWVLPNKSAATGVSVLFFFISSAQVALAPRVPVRTEVRTFPLADANETLAQLRTGRLQGAAVLVITEAS